ncbi:Hypothetical_protein [Hexamita inflata]|uniref:Hypothetical_protein n=1 Tax=Hexamita inflata TaxID=28002 RepID=A0ABP1GIA2_9EUKA
MKRMTFTFSLLHSSVLVGNTTNIRYIFIITFRIVSAFSTVKLGSNVTLMSKTCYFYNSDLRAARQRKNLKYISLSIIACVGSLVPNAMSSKYQSKLSALACVCPNTTQTAGTLRISIQQSQIVSNSVLLSKSLILAKFTEYVTYY